MQTRRFRRGLTLLLATGCLWAAGPVGSEAARESKLKAEGLTEGDVEARRLLDKAQELLQAQENDRATKMLESIIEQYPNSRVRFNACLALGRHYIDSHEQAKAINYLNRLKALEDPDKELTGPDKDMFLEAIYLIGVGYFQMRQYGAAFPLLRKITNNYPNTIWANQAYYYIGMCHFAQQNWNRAIESLGLVGTFVDPDSPTVQYAEAGRRFYVKIQDADLPILVAMGKTINVSAETSHGDKEKLDCIPLNAEGDVFIGSIPTEIGLPKPADHILQVVGGDSIVTRYVDEHTQDGQANVAREGKVKVVSTAVIDFTLGDYETRAVATFLDHPLFVVLHDVDMDTSDAADAVTVKIVSQYKEEEAAETEAVKGVSGAKALQEGETRYKIRDQVMLRLTEQGPAPVHSGRFGGSLPVEAVKGDGPIDQTDQILTCALDDTVVATYSDDLNIDGEVRREAEAKTVVLGEIDNRPKATQNVVFDPVIRSKKNLVEAQAFLELARIFKSMGLVKGAKEKADEALDRVNFVIRSQTPIPSAIKQDAFKLKWEIHIVADDFGSAIATCQLFNRLYPDSPFVDEALLGIGNIRMENKQYREAIAVFSQVLSLPKSEAKAQAQFRIAEATEAVSKPGSDAAIEQYKLCAERYPDSQYAGVALSKLVDYHTDTKDYAQANALLEQIFQDYPDAPFLDSMLLKWVLVAYRSGDLARASEKCSKLIFEYPESPYAEKAKQVMPRIEAQLNTGSAKTTEKGGEQ